MGGGDGSGTRFEAASEALHVVSAEERRQEGRQQGLQEGKSSMLLELLEERFGTLPSDLRSRILSAETAALDTWGRRLINAPDLKSIFRACPDINPQRWSLLSKTL
jgi:Domain of unknown function (DUF4351)